MVERKQDVEHLFLESEALVEWLSLQPLMVQTWELANSMHVNFDHFYIRKKKNCDLSMNEVQIHY